MSMNDQNQNSPNSKKTNQFIYIAIGITILVLIIMSIYFWPQKPEPIAKHPYDFSGPCPGETTTEKMNDIYMRGILEKDQEYKLEHNWYWCKPVERGDLVLLKFSDKFPPIVRKVYGIPKDKFEVVYDKSHMSWKIKIQNEWLSVNNEIYYFGTAAKTLLKQYEEGRHGILGEREILVFTNIHPGITDSTTLGIVNLNDVVGRVQLIK